MSASTPSSVRKQSEPHAFGASANMATALPNVVNFPAQTLSFLG